MDRSCLVDSHTFLWAMTMRPGLSKAAIAVLEDRRNGIVLSSASAWEMLIKYRLGKLVLPFNIAYDVERAAVGGGF